MQSHVRVCLQTSLLASPALHHWLCASRTPGETSLKKDKKPTLSKAIEKAKGRSELKGELHSKQEVEQEQGNVTSRCAASSGT